MVQEPIIDPGEVEKEKRVVLEELGLAQDAPGEWVHQILSELLWPDQPLGREIAGTAETVNAQTGETIRAYIDRGYGPANTVLMVAGDADPEHIIRLATDRFNRSGAPPPSFAPAVEATGQPLVGQQGRETEQAYICVGGKALRRDDPDRYALRLANAILGDGMSSRLFLEVRERRGLAYDVHSYVSAFQDAGALVVNAGVEPEQTQAALAAILGEVDTLRQGRVPETELRKVKEYIKGRTVLSLEDSASVAQWYAAQTLLTEELLTPDEVIARLEEVSTEDVLRVTRRVFTNEWLNLAFIGPRQDEDRLRGLLKLP